MCRGGKQREVGGRGEGLRLLYANETLSFQVSAQQTDSGNDEWSHAAENKLGNLPKSQH